MHQFGRLCQTLLVGSVECTSEILTEDRRNSYKKTLSEAEKMIRRLLAQLLLTDGLVNW